MMRRRDLPRLFALSAHARSPTLPQHSRDTAGAVVRRLDGFFQETMCGVRAVTRPAIGPRPAMIIGLTGRRTGFAVRIGRNIERPIDAAAAVQGKLEGA